MNANERGTLDLDAMRQLGTIAEQPGTEAEIHCRQVVEPKPVVFATSSFGVGPMAEEPQLVQRHHNARDTSRLRLVGASIGMRRRRIT